MFTFCVGRLSNIFEIADLGTVLLYGAIVLRRVQKRLKANGMVSQTCSLVNVIEPFGQIHENDACHLLVQCLASGIVRRFLPCLFEDHLLKVFMHRFFDLNLLNTLVETGDPAHVSPVRLKI